MRIAFDRGTVVLQADQAWFAPPELTDLVWDARVGVWRTPAWRYPELVRAIGSAEAIDGVKRGAPPEGRFALPELRPYQETALAAWELAGRRGIVALPTGSGKTLVGLAAARAVAAPVLCVVPTRVLLEQWYTRLGAVYRGRIGRLGDGYRDVAPVTVATFESALRALPQLGNRFGLLVIDEVHHLASSREELLEMAIAPARLGLTATPPEIDGRLPGRLEELVGRVVFRLTIADLVGEYLAPVERITWQLPLSADERARYERDRRCFQEAYQAYRWVVPLPTWAGFVREASATDGGRRALAAFRRSRDLVAWTAAKGEALRLLLDRHREERTLIFTAHNAAAYAIARRELVMPLTAHVSRRERSDALGLFRAGRLRALVSCRVLNEGLDVPDADVGVIVGGSQGNREHVQRVGRILRPRPGKRACLYELIAEGTHEVRTQLRRADALGLQQDLSL